jgi:hypothetical protein
VLRACVAIHQFRQRLDGIASDRFRNSGDARIIRAAAVLILVNAMSTTPADRAAQRVR